jgi:hypothetical protein
VVWGPGAVITTMCAIVVATIHILPETKQHVLPQTLREFESWDDNANIADKSDHDPNEIPKTPDITPETVRL